MAKLLHTCPECGSQTAVEATQALVYGVSEVQCGDCGAVRRLAHPSKTPPPMSVKQFCDLANLVRTFMGQAVNIWGEEYIKAGGQRNDEEAHAQADKVMYAWIQSRRRWPELKEAMKNLSL